MLVNEQNILSICSAVYKKRFNKRDNTFYTYMSFQIIEQGHINYSLIR
jgi:hypothetical protein